MKRRSFLRTVGGAAGGYALGMQTARGAEGYGPKAKAKEDKVAGLPRRVLGRTGEKVSIVGFPGLALVHQDQTPLVQPKDLVV